MSPWLQQKLATYKHYSGGSLLNTQYLLFVVALAISAIQWFLADHASLLSTIIYTFVAGNVITIVLALAGPLYDQPFPRDWIVYTALLLPVAVLASTAGGVIDRLVLGMPLASLTNLRNGDIPFGTLVSIVIGLSIHAYASTRSNLEAANSQLSQEVHHGRRELEAQASELKAAFEIQSNLLPRTIPQIAGVEISCAWQPARTVSGDYYDVLPLSETRIAICLADVSGKGISAALITANLQATLRAFAPEEPSPANLCRRLNQALCASLPTGRFVTMAYGILDRRHMTLTYELAGHNSPILLRGKEVITLEGTGPVLGILPNATFEDHTIHLQPGDRLLLTTDGITEAFNPTNDEGGEEEFGESRVIAAAQSGQQTAHAIRTNIMTAVTTFAAGNFHDDASLLIVHLQP
ncbi:PP2C family protein-serine/threonine phosphatase [Granulicella tundricola]|uniref:Protein serine/threonine phosphatase n=1 Tax=Granulicella tundricola (strain ATCC BAA-1859 / DSM 23138 / MP5ACTX9) TaxID=1198114 RepID=E8WYF5_GRATM|nr:PP2C family protein-serine/threonine phosphatase [Granulicella tundricola]ADW69861.1 protein serine/threonine phosphatase [Granulicella tundricola MP5ACTX9]